MDYVLGIDSGGTNFRIMAGDCQGNVLGSYTGRPANHYCVPEKEIKQIVNQSLDACLAQFGGRREDCRYLVVGTTGLDSDQDGEYLRNLYGQIPGLNCPQCIMNDAELAHYTVTGGSGVLVISGTGSIGFGRDRLGHTARAGGWFCTILGDEGSGSWVSKRALRQLGRWLDGAAAEGVLIRSLRKELSVHTREDLNDIAVRMADPPWKPPELGKLVNEAAAAGDPDAVAILKEAAALMLTIAEDVATALHLDENEPGFPLGIWGSNILKSPVLCDVFCALAAKRFPGSPVVRPARSATEGAVQLALERLNAEKGTAQAVS